MLYYFFSEQRSTWEHRVGSYVYACGTCRQQAWQHVFRVYQTHGTPASPGTPLGPVLAERFQTRCSSCGTAASVAHPSTWAATVQGWVQEWGPAGPGTPRYVALAYPAT